MRRLVCLLAVGVVANCFCLFSVQAQSPGGVNSSLKLWLKANAGVTGVTNASGWTDQSANAFVASQATGTSQPAILSNRLNFNPSIQFDGVDDQMIVASGIMGASTYTDLNFFAVTRVNQVTSSSLFYETQAGGGGRVNAHMPWGDNNIYWDAGSANANQRLSVNWGGAINTGYIWSLLASTTATASGQRQDIFRNGLSISSDNTMTSFTGNNSPFYLGSLAGANYYRGEISELIAYTGTLTAAQQQRIQGYLAIKYGITMPVNYVASSGTNVWDVTANSGYNSNIAGIGRDDASALDQQQSRSINTGADVTMNKGGAFGTDLSFLMWGDNNAVGTSADVPAGYVKRMSKVWKTSVKGSPGVVNFSIDLTDLGLPIGLNATDYALLIDADGTFNAGSTIHTTGAALGAAQLSFSNVSFNDGDYFTIAVLSSALKGPANVTDNLKLWLKANTGVTGGPTPITGWNDQSGNGYNATVPANGPQLLTNQVNFNPVLDFTSASQQYLQINGGIMGSSSYNNTWTYVVSKTDIIQNQTTFFEALSGGETFNALMPWGNSNIYLDYGNGAGRLNGAWGGSVNSYNFWTLGASNTAVTPNGTQRTISRDGAVILSNANNDTGTGNNQPFFIGGGYNTGVGTANPFDGKIAEMIIYTGVPTELEQEQIQSYLAVKYGITKTSADIAGTPGQDERDYFASSGSVIWDYSNLSAYHNNVSGIGRDDASGLDQQQSRSINTGADVTMNKGGAFGTDLSYIVWGDDNAANGTSTDTPGGYAKRLNKVWRAAVSGTPGVVNFSIDLTDLGLPIGLASTDYALLKDADGTFNAGATIHTTGAAIGAAQLSFTNVSFNDGDYFTIAVASSALRGPVGITNNLKLWLKADMGVNGGPTPITGWNDQSGNGYNATVPGNGPQKLTNQLNFNPVIDFTSASQQYLQINGGIMGSSTYNSAWTYVVTKGDVIQNNTLFFESLTGGESLTSLLPWSNSNVYYDFGNNGTGRINGAWGGSINSYNMWTLGASTTSATPNGTNRAISRDGAVILSNNNTDNGVGNNQPFFIGGGYNTGVGTANPFDGKIAEMIIYTGVPTELEQEQIQSYLAVKYGLTKNSADIAGTAAQDESDYFSSTGSVIWDYSANTTYHNNVAGIGRDDKSELDQRQSLSANAGADVTLNKGGAFGTDLSYIVWGDNNAANGTSTDIPGGYAKRLNKVWRTAVTGTPGVVNFSIDLTDLGLPIGLNAIDYALLIDADGTFNAGATIFTTGAAISSAQLSFTNVSFNDGDYFTIAVASTALKGPANITNNLKLWLKADAGVVGTTPITSWTDQAGNGYVATAPGNGPQILTNQLNFNPVIDFTSASQQYLQINGGIMGSSTYNSAWTYVVTKGDVIQNNTLFFESLTGGESLTSLLPWSNSNVYYDFGNNGTGRINGAWGGSVNNYNMWTLGASTTAATPNGTNRAISRDGAVILSNNNTDNGVGNNQPFFIGGGYNTGVGTANPLDGKIAEMIIYTGVPTELEQEQIQSYLAVKYGITKNSADIAGTAAQDERDYFASSGSVIWDYSVNSTYHNNVTAIGRDDASILDQRKSRSINAASVLTLDKGAAFSTDLGFVVAGDDAGALTSTALSLAPYTMRPTRIWKTNVTGTPGTISVSFDLSTGLHNSGNVSDYALLIKNADTNFGSGATIHTTGASISNNVLTFTNVNFTDGDYFTLGLVVYIPGGAQTPVFWVKAGSGVTGTTNVSLWADQSGLGNNATQATVSNQPSLVTNDINFNPSINFSGNSAIMTPTSAPANLNTTVFAVGNPNVNTAWRTMFRGTASDHQIIVESGGTRLGYYDNDNVGFKPSGFTWLQNEVALVELEMRTGDVNFRKNGTQGASINTINLAGLNLNYFGNYQGNGQPFGKIAETIIYNNATALTTSEKETIESYLAVKYGITLSHNYYATDATITWNLATNATYSNRVTGIGRDDITTLDQRKSKSVNSGAVLTLEKTTPGSAFSTDKNFLIAGDDGGQLGATTNNVHPSYPMRVERIWRTDLTGTPGTVSVSFDLGTGIYNSGVATDYALLIKNADANFSTGAAAYTGGASIVSNVLTFTNVALAEGDYFTLALPRIASPGGIVNNLRFWLKANAGVTGGANASSWADQTSYNYIASQATPANQPTVLSSRLNFNPAIQFDGTNDQLTVNSGIMGTATYNDINVFIISRVNTIQASSIFYETQAAGGRINTHLPWNDNNVYWDAGSGGAPHRLNVAWGGAINTGYLWSLLASTSSTALGNQQNIVRNGLSIAFDATMASFTGNSSNLTIGVNNGGNYYNGEVSELITYTGTLSAAQYRQIQSYLALKYAITLDQTTQTNYVASNGTVLWDAAANATYKNDIAGIGRDDASALSQPKSKSSNANSIVTMDKGTTFVTDLDFLIWGNDNAYNSPTTVGKHPSYPYRLGKTWRVDRNGTPGAVSVSFDLSVGIYNTGVATDYALIVNGTGNDFSAGTAITAGAAFNGTTLTFPNVTFADGDYFTLAMPTPPAPGGVVNNMGMWLKANLGVTGGANASAWADQSGNNFNVTQATGANQPTILTNRTNFNPAIQFDGTNDNLSLTSGILGTNTLTDVYAFSVSRTNTITAAYAFYENNTAGQFSLRLPWNDNNLYWEPGNTGTNRVNTLWGGTVATPFVWGLTSSTTATPSGQRQDIIRNGFTMASDATMNSFTGNNSVFYLGSGAGASYYTGEISELVIYRGALTGAMTQQIQSYLALKYGITLSSINYLSSAGTSIFNTTTTQASYSRDIAGIGRDDNSALSQTKSKSVNSPSDLISIANTDFNTPTAFANSGEFLIWGNNGLPTLADVNAASYTHAGTLIVRQLNRVWSTQKTLTPAGSAILEVDMNLVMGPSGLGTNNTSDIRLLVDNDAVFGNSSGGEFVYTPGSVSAGKLYFTVPYANINAGQGYFTVGSVNATTAPMSAPTPGGVLADMRLWLKADAGVTGATPVTAWADQSANGYSAVAVGNSPNLLTNQINNNPALDFTSASQQYLRIANGVLGSTTYNDAWVYVISTADLNQNQTSFFEATTGGEYFDALIPWSGTLYYDFGNSAGIGRISGAWGGTYGTYNMWTLGSSTSTTTPNGTRKTVSRDGGVIFSSNNNDNTTGANQPFLIGGGYSSGVGTTNPFDGRIAEMIVYAEVPTELEQEKIQSYLAIKYGIHKGSADIAGTPAQDERDYFSSDGTVIWDYSANLTYSNKITGIGRDDISALDQRKSQNLAAQSFVQIDKGGAFSADKNFLLWGHDSGLLGLTTVGAHASLTYRVARIWKAQITGGPMTVSVSFDLSSGIYNSGNAADYRLLKNTSTNFSSGTATVGTFAGNVITFSGISVSDGDFFTLGVANMPAPGGVVPNMQYWVKADLGVTGGANASAWADQSGNAFNVTQATAANQPTIVSNRTNFNPAIQFDGTNDQMTLTGGILGTSTYTDFNVFMLARTNTVTASFAFLENMAAGGRLSATSPFSDNLVYWDAGGTGANQRLTAAWGGNTATNYIWGLTASTTATASGARQDIYRNGRRIANDNTMASSTGNNSVFNLGSSGGGNYYNGEIDELVIYRGALTLSQLQKIQSYLAVKYGVTLDQTAATSYYASDWNGATGTLIWDATAAGSYKTDITAIGRDDNSALNQKQSASVNTGNILTIGNTAIATDNASNANNFTTDKSFFSWAHNNAAVAGFGIVDMGTTVNSENIVARVARTWLAKETGTVGTLKLRFSMAAVLGVGGVAGANDLTDVRLLVDADGVFATGATSIAPTTFNNATDIVEFDYDFAPGTGFYFSIGSVNLSTAPLPVELLSFEATPASDGVDVKWVTASEVNNDYFVVQASPDAKAWYDVATVAGQGTKRSETKYQILDSTPLMGVSYYRLKQVDLDTRVSYSDLVKVDYQGAGIKIFPNPSNGKDVTIEINSVSAEVLTVEISSLQGQVLYTYSVDNTEPRRQRLLLDFTSLSQGMYFVSLKSTDKVRTTKLIIEK